MEGECGCVAFLTYVSQKNHIRPPGCGKLGEEAGALLIREVTVVAQYAAFGLCGSVGFFEHPDIVIGFDEDYSGAVEVVEEFWRSVSEVGGYGEEILSTESDTEAVANSLGVMRELKAHHLPPAALDKDSVDRTDKCLLH